jgi:hypothetical protein
MKVTVSFANPFLFAIYAATFLTLGFAIGAHWGHTLAAGWALFIATILLVIHDSAMAVILAFAASRFTPSDRK